jgi:hypothetical protein
VPCSLRLAMHVFHLSYKVKLALDVGHMTYSVRLAMDVFRSYIVRPAMDVCLLPFSVKWQWMCVMCHIVWE